MRQAGLGRAVATHFDNLGHQVELVDEHLDLARVYAGYAEGRGAPPYDPRLMVRVLLYG